MQEKSVKLPTKEVSWLVHKGNQFLHYTDINKKLHCNLSLCEIMFLFLLDIPMVANVWHACQMWHS